MADAYTESMSLACQFGRCEECPENDDPDGYCSCTHHIPDPEPAGDETDALAKAFYERWSCA